MDNEWGFGCFIVLVGIGMLFYDLGERKGTKIMEQEAIERGYASFCPLDGKWAWNGECKEKE